MGIENTETVDMMTKSLDGLDNGLDLMIIDAGSVANETTRYAMLVDKLGAYVNFVMSDEFARDYPRTTAAQVMIRVLCATPPTEAMLKVSAVYPGDDKTQRIRVVFEDVDEWKQRLTGK